MLPKVAVGLHCCAPSTNVENYRALVGDDLVEEIQQFSRDLKDVRVCRINATASGGGVAELLGRQIPLYHALGIQVDWRIIHGDKDFFTVTKGFHDALQGAEFRVTSSVAEEYQEQNRLSAKMLDGPYDVYLVCDPQPAALRQDLKMQRVVFIPSAIDPLATKNMDLPHDLCRRVIADAGLDLHRPRWTATPRGCAASFTAKRTGCAAGAFNTAGYTEAIRATTARSTGVAAGRAASTATCGRRWVSTGVWGRGTCLVARSMAQVIWMDEGNGNSCLLREVRST